MEARAAFFSLDPAKKGFSESDSTTPIVIISFSYYLKMMMKEGMSFRIGLNGKSIFSTPFGSCEKEVAAYRNKLGWAAGSFSDCLAVLHAYQAMHDVLIE